MTAVRPHRARPACLPFFLLLGGLAAFLGGCSTHTNSSPGTPVITMSATNAGFNSYSISIDGITLTRDDNTTYTPLYVAQTVDIANLAGGTEVVEAPAVPAGNYISGTVIFDYAAASIWYQVNGQPHPLVAYAQDGATVLTGQTVVTVTFDKAHPLVITNPKSVRLAVNFDLAAFNTVTNTITSPGAVIVRPFVTMSPVTVDYQPLRVRGFYVTNQTGNFIMNVSPFHDLSNALGGMQVNVNDQTYYSVSQRVYTGAPGEAAIGTLQISQPIAAFGTLGSLDAITPQFNATEVYGGISQENLLQDHLHGVIAERNGNQLILRGAQLYSLSFGNVYNVTATVIVDDTTVVTEDGHDVAGLGPQSLSVGQYIDAAAAGPASEDSSFYITLDTRSGGQVRMQQTDAWGNLNSASAGSASLNLLTLAGYQPAGFNFNGTATGGGAVDPTAYPVNTGAATAVGPLVLAQGVAAPFGSAPPAFNARTVTEGTTYPQQQLVVEWGNGGTAEPFSTQTAAGLVVDLANADLGTTHGIFTGPSQIDLKSLPASPLITTTGANQQALTLAVGNSVLTTGVSVYNSADAFSTALTATFNGDTRIYRLVAVGQYNAATNTFVAQNIDVALQQ